MKISKEKMLTALALEIIDFEGEELLMLTEEEGRFKLIDTTSKNFDNIEQDRFDALAEVLDRLDTYADDYICHFLDNIEDESAAARNMQDLKKDLSLFERMAYQLLRNAPDDWWEILNQIKPEDLKDWPRNDDGTYSQSVFDDFRNDEQNVEFMEQELSQSFLQTITTDPTRDPFAYQKEEEGSEELSQEQEEEREI